MKVNVKLDINDTERDMLANYIDDADTSRLATRKDVNSFVQGCVDAAVCMPIPEPVSEEAEISLLRTAGRNDNYIRGWLQVGRRC